MRSLSRWVALAVCALAPVPALAGDRTVIVVPPPTITYYVPPPVAYYAPPPVTYYAPPPVAYYAPPPVVVAPAPPTTTVNVTTYRNGLCQRRTVTTVTVTSGPFLVTPAPAPPPVTVLRPTVVVGYR